MNEWIVRGLFSVAGAATLRIVQIITAKVMEERAEAKEPAQIEAPVEIETTAKA